ncbi:MAG: hypothetical protein J2P45_14760, partial [Candidatus Dormibacteraeota bacterium]|nr:hypothetical protein [Candidatus Dormibacteraeota bacterium]
PMRMGVPGMVTFWGLIGMAILEACWVARGHADPFIRGVAVFVVAALAAELVVAYGDLQLESYRNMIFLGCLLGVLVNLPRLAEDG